MAERGLADDWRNRRFQRRPFVAGASYGSLLISDLAAGTSLLIMDRFPRRLLLQKCKQVDELAAREALVQALWHQ